MPISDDVLARSTIPTSERELVDELAELRRRLYREQDEAPSAMSPGRALSELSLDGRSFSHSRSERHRAWLRRIDEIEAALGRVKPPWEKRLEQLP